MSLLIELIRWGLAQLGFGGIGAGVVLLIVVALYARQAASLGTTAAGAASSGLSTISMVALALAAGALFGVLSVNFDQLAQIFLVASVWVSEHAPTPMRRLVSGLRAFFKNMS